MTTTKIRKKWWDFSWEDVMIRKFNWLHNLALEEKKSCLKIPYN